MASATHLTSKREQKFIARGVSGIIEQITESMVVKHAISQSDKHAIALEMSIYERLGPHPSITRYYKYPCDEGTLRLELLQCSLKDRLHQLSKDGKVPSKDCLFRWARQLTEGLAHIHSCRVNHVDVGCQNVLIDWNDNVKLCDFAGSSIDGSEPEYCPSDRFVSPRIPIPSISADLFAFGSLLYEMETTQPPYYDKTESEVQSLFNNEQFLDTRKLKLGKIIWNCWNSTYISALDVMEDLDAIARNLAIRGACTFLLLVCLFSLLWIGLKGLLNRCISVA
jgi:serine/threonine protein kinase